MKIKVAYVTTARSDYGPSYWLIHDLFSDARFATTLLVGGAHFSKRHGRSFTEVEKHAWPSVVRLPFLGLGGDEASFARSAGRALRMFGEYFSQNPPDVVVLYGDRVELLPIATAAVLNCVPIAHLSGGEVTEGAFDEQVRHALTKLSHLHFTTSKLATTRLLQMGEEAWRVRTVGDPALDQLRRGESAGLQELQELLGCELGSNTLLVTFHPPTLERECTRAQVRQLVEALRSHSGSIIITAPAPDPGCDDVTNALRAFARARKNVVFVDHLGSYCYRGLLSIVGALVGNSSSGIIEASGVPVPTVNIGNRQKGRERGSNVIDVRPVCAKISAGIKRALSKEFRRTMNCRSPYGDGRSAQRIVTSLAKLPHRSRLLGKRFVLLRHGS